VSVLIMLRFGAFITTEAFDVFPHGHFSVWIFVYRSKHGLFYTLMTGGYRIIINNEELCWQKRSGNDVSSSERRLQF